MKLDMDLGKTKVAGVSSDSLVVGMACAASLVLLVDSMIPDRPVRDEQARENARQIAEMASLAVAAGRTDLQDAKSVEEAVQMVSAGVTVPSPHSFGIEMVTSPYVNKNLPILNSRTIHL